MLDANIPIRAILGNRVRTLLTRYGGRVRFFAPESAFEEARDHLPEILGRRGIPLGPALEILDSLNQLVQPVSLENYRSFEQDARERMRGRDEEDWPILATALALDCAIWTEDADFFGAGVATWTTDRVELFLAQSSR